MYGRAGLPNPLAPEHPKVKIVSTKGFLHNATWSGVYGDITWVGVLQPNADTLEHGATKHDACVLAAHATLEAAENAAGNIAEHATCGAMYHSADKVAASSIEHTKYSAPSGSKSDQLLLE